MSIYWVYGRKRSDCGFCFVFTPQFRGKASERRFQVNHADMSYILATMSKQTSLVGSDAATYFALMQRHVKADEPRWFRCSDMLLYIVGTIYLYIYIYIYFFERWNWHVCLFQHDRAPTAMDPAPGTPRRSRKEREDLDGWYRRIGTYPDRNIMYLYSRHLKRLQVSARWILVQGFTDWRAGAESALLQEQIYGVEGNVHVPNE